MCRYGERRIEKGEATVDKSNTHKQEAAEIGADARENAQWRVEDTEACSAQQLGQGKANKENPLTKRVYAKERRYEVATRRVCSLSHGKK